METLPLQRREVAPPTLISSFSLWIFFYCYATLTALLFQKLLLPMVPSLHAGMGLLGTDSLIHHQLALDLANKIQAEGWASWTPWSHVAGTGNVGVLAALYVLFIPDPALIVPINSALHASGGLILFLIGEKVWVAKGSNIGGLIAAILFITFPSSINWYGQVHKDGYAILGYLIVLYGCISALQSKFSFSSILKLCLCTAAGTGLVLFVRPYAILLLLGSLSLAFFATTIFYRKLFFKLLMTGTCALFIIGTACIFAGSVSLVSEQTKSYESDKLQHIFPDWHWKKTANIPTIVDELANSLARFRKTSIQHAYHSNSMIDKNIVHTSSIEIVEHIPRAAQVALLAPFPTDWKFDGSPTKIVGAMETLIWYLVAPGILFALRYLRSPTLIFTLMFATTFITVYGYAIANLGTLHRLRYPFLACLILIGCSGWYDFTKQFILTKFSRHKNLPIAPENGSNDVYLNSPSGPDVEVSRSRSAISSIAVIVLALGSFTLFFLRDLLASKTLGVTSELDAFFMSLLIPMFIVNILFIPLGSAILPFYIDIKNRFNQNSAQEFISSVAFYIYISLIVFATVLFFFAPQLVSIIGAGFSEIQHEKTISLLPIGIGILLLSGGIILGNTILNANYYFVAPTLAQCFVPLTSIAFLIYYGSSYGAFPIAIGMLLGQLVNFIIVLFLLKNIGTTLTPKAAFSKTQFKSISNLLSMLVISALLINCTQLIGSSMASSLKEGSVSAYSLGFKVVAFITGIVTTGVTTVLLPYFSSYLSRGKIEEGKKELSFYLVSTSILVVPFTCLLFVHMHSLVELVFLGGMIDEAAVFQVSQVARYSVVQLPFFISYTLIAKFANAAKNMLGAAAAASIGLAFQILISHLLIDSMGIAGISLAISLSIFVSTVALLGLSYKMRFLSLETLIYLMIFWALYLTIILCLHFSSYSGVAIASIAMLFVTIEVINNFSTEKKWGDNGYVKPTSP